jgi:hypothetical protein
MQQNDAFFAVLNLSTILFLAYFLPWCWWSRRKEKPGYKTNELQGKIFDLFLLMKEGRFPKQRVKRVLTLYNVAKRIPHYHLEKFEVAKSVRLSDIAFLKQVAFSKQYPEVQLAKELCGAIVRITKVHKPAISLAGKIPRQNLVHKWLLIILDKKFAFKIHCCQYLFATYEEISS